MNVTVMAMSVVDNNTIAITVSADNLLCKYYLEVSVCVVTLHGTCLRPYTRMTTQQRSARLSIASNILAIVQLPYKMGGGL